MAITVPPLRGIGDTGHVGDSNTVRQALLDLDAQKAAQSQLSAYAPAWHTHAGQGDPIPQGWTPYNPALSGTGSPGTIGDASHHCTYLLLGKLTVVRGGITFGASSSFGAGGALISVPMPAVASGVNRTPRGMASILDVSAGVSLAFLLDMADSADWLSLRAISTGGAYAISETATGTSPISPVSPGDVITYQAIYEAA